MSMVVIKDEKCTQYCAEASTEEPGALAGAADNLALVVALATLHLTGVTIAVVVSPGLAEPLQQVAVTGVDVRTGQQLAPGAAPHLAGPVVELRDPAALHQGERPARAVVVEARATGSHRQLVSIAPGNIHKRVRQRQLLIFNTS